MLWSEREAESQIQLRGQKYLAVFIATVVVVIMAVADFLLAHNEMKAEPVLEPTNEEAVETVMSGASEEAIVPPIYKFETFSESGLASFSPSDGSSFEVGADIDFVLEIFSGSNETVTVPVVELYQVGESEPLGDCEDVVSLESPDGGGVFSATCTALSAGDYVARAAWIEGENAEPGTGSRHTITSLFFVRDSKKVPATRPSAPSVGALEIEFLGGGWGAWNHGQYYSVSGTSVVRSWCLRSAPGIAWRDENNRAVILNPDGSIGETLAVTSNSGSCVISGSVNAMEDGDTGELRTISIPSSTLLPRLGGEGCLIVRFIPGSTSFEPAWDDVCVRMR